MRKFTKSMLTLALLVLAVGGAKAQTKVYATFANPTNTNTTWTADGSGNTKGTFTWSTTYYNQLKNIGLHNGDISDYKKLVVDCTITKGTQFRILFYQGSANLTLYAKDGVNEWNIYDELKKLKPEGFADYILSCTEICLSGDNGAAPGEAVINDMYLETYGPGEEKPSDLIPETPETDPGKPAGTYTELTAAMFNASITVNLGKKFAKGDIIYGQKNKNYADLGGYSKLTVVGTPGLKLVFNLNHQIDVKENSGDYSAEEAGKYVWADGTIGEATVGADGVYELDLTSYYPVHLNNIRLPWEDISGWVWYLLLTEGTAYNMVMDEVGYATFSNKKIVEMPSGMEAYTAKIDGDKVALTKIEGAVPADNAVILKATAGNYSLPFAASATALSENELKVSDGSVTGDGSIYVLANKNSVTGFYKLASGQKVPAGKAYLTKAGDAPEFLPFEGGVTGIETVKAAKANNEIFNLAGQRVAKTAKGLYIVNGKKVVVK